MYNMKILLISASDLSQPYGSTTRPSYFAKYLAKSGCEILHLCSKPAAYEDNIKYFPQEYYVEKKKYLKLKILYKECKLFSPDIIYAHQLGGATLGVILKYLLNKPLVYDAHSSAVLEMPTYSGISWRRKIMLRLNEKIILKLADKIIAVSKELEEFLIGEYGIPYKKFNIVKNGVETDVFMPEKADINIKKKLRLSGNEKCVVFTNPRLSSFPTNDMALHYLFEMIPDIERKISNIKFVILGGGVRPAPPSENVIYTGFVEDLPAYLNNADVCIAPFPPEAVCGGTRNKVNEYFACGKAVISTREGMRGFDDAVPGKHYVLGKDKDEFIDKLIYCINNPKEAERIGKDARELSLSYDWNVLSKKVIKCLNETLYLRSAINI